MSSNGQSPLALHPTQHEVFKNRARFKVVAAGRRWGKTHLSGVSMLQAAAGGQKRLVWYIAPTYKMARQIMWPTLLELIPRKWIRRVNETFLTIELKNRSMIVLKGADKPDSLRGVGLHYVVLDEFQDMAKQVWTQAIRPTLAETGGHALFIGTPKAYNHLYELWEAGQDERLIQANEWCSWQYRTIDSPFIPELEVEQARRELDEKSFKQEFLASFEVMAGRVYHAFDRRNHVGKYPFNPKLPIWIGQDFNIDPMSSVVLQPQPNGEVWAVDELVLWSSNTEEVCDELERRYWRYKKQCVIYPDPASGARQHARGETDLDIFREKGFKKIKFRKKHPAVQDRINAVNRMLHAADGSEWLKVDEGCRNFIQSLEQTLYKEGKPEIDKSMNIEHITDAGGYAIEIEYPLRKVDIGGASI